MRGSNESRNKINMDSQVNRSEQKIPINKFMAGQAN